MATPAFVLTVYRGCSRKATLTSSKLQASQANVLEEKNQCLVLSNIPGSVNGHSFTTVKGMTLQCLLTYKQRKISKQNTDPAFVS